MQWWLVKSHMPDGSLTVAQNGGWVVGLKDMNLGHQDLIIWPLCDATKATRPFQCHPSLCSVRGFFHKCTRCCAFVGDAALFYTCAPTFLVCLFLQHQQCHQS